VKTVVVECGGKRRELTNPSLAQFAQALVELDELIRH